ncbi:MAG: hypothetical protein A2Z88_09215 [Omnitrophica WOR_2 bacterium GWA2_47_8]|nr:MAG: hypothetical protein A2Z88_09215 [Omnitrophica WOR_2 bacterium GWA2_47_8]
MKLNRKIKIGSRESRLAKVQVEEILDLLKKKGVRLDFEQRFFKTKGDKDKKTSLTTSPADDFFTDSLDKALLAGKIDITVHSAKDLPQSLREGLDVLALTASIDGTDAFVGKACLKDLKRGAMIGTSSLLRKRSLKELYPRLKAVDIRGTIEERIALVEKGKCDGIIVATAALKRLGLAHLIKDIFPWEATPLQGQLAVVGRAGDLELEEIFKAIDMRKDYGKVTLAGAGPGDPELITLKGIKALQGSDCVFYDYLADKQLLEYAPQAEKIYAGKRKGEHALSQAKLSSMIRQKALEGKSVVRLKGGDPLIFGRGGDEIIYLRSHFIEVEIIPGVSSATGIPSQLGIPLTARGISSSVAFLSGHSEDESSKRFKLLVIPRADTLIFLMGLTKLKQIVQALKKHGWKKATPMMAIAKGTRLDEKIACGTIETIEKLVTKEKLEPPVLFIVGETVKFWRKNKMRDENILYLGTNPSKYRNLGRIIHFPVIEIAVKDAPSLKAQLLKAIPGTDLTIFTSRYAVHAFFKSLGNNDSVMKSLRQMAFAVIGNETHLALAAYGFTAGIAAETETSQGLWKVLKEKDIAGKRILFPRSSLPNPFLKEKLTQLGCEVQEIAAYENVKPAKQDLPRERVDKIFFTSPSTVHNFLESYGRIPQPWQILCRGPLTDKALQEAGYKTNIQVLD